MSPHALPSRVVIVGAGQAGARCAESLRHRGFEGRVTVLGDEPHAPYDRPSLSKSLLAGVRSATDLTLPTVRTWRDRDIELRTSARVTAVDPRRREVLLAGGEALRYDALVLATGARARTIETPTCFPNLLTLRTLDDAAALLRELDGARRLVVVGAGFVGSEVASTVLGLGIEVTIVEALPAPLARALGDEVGALLADRYRAAGVDLRTGTSVAALHDDGRGRVTAVELADGTRVACDVVVVGIGATPVAPASLAGDGWGAGAAGGGWSVDRAGIPTDACGRTGVEHVHACGDVASWWRGSLGRHLRVEHWTSAAAQASAVAGAIVGDDAGSDELPFFWSDQFGMRLQHVGFPVPFDRVEVEAAGDGSVVARYVDAVGRQVGVLAIDRPDVIARARREGSCAIMGGNAAPGQSATGRQQDRAIGGTCASA